MQARAHAASACHSIHLLGFVPDSGVVVTLVVVGGVGARLGGGEMVFGVIMGCHDAASATNTRP